ncbi:sensor histidine kinase [Pseudogemmobacter humi]|nr:sensor histidine kinase [Pseudogemmobacter humi]
MILVALLPLGLLALAQARQSQRQADETAMAASIGRTLQEALGEVRLIRASQITAQLLASVLRDDMAHCRTHLASYAAADPRIARAAFVPLSGRMECSSDGSAQDFTGLAHFARMRDARAPQIFSDPGWSSSGAVEISVVSPVATATGEPMGFVLISLPETAMTGGEMSARGGAERPLALIASNRAGEVVYASVGIAAAADYLPATRDLARINSAPPQSFADTTPDGMRRMFASVPLTHDLHLLGVWPLPRDGGFLGRNALAYLLPALMWLTGVGVTFLGVERLVTRHVRRLAKAMRAFGSDSRSMPELDLDNPPAEIASLAEAYRTMTATILRDEAELENLLRQKAGLLREVHHRTGNSLQLIASFLRMHRRETEEENIRAVLDDLHNRVMSLSTVHLGLYRMAGGADVEVDQLMAEVIGRVDQIYGRSGHKDAITADLHPLVLGSAQAVPLALLLAEILSCFPSGGEAGPPILIRLGPVPGAGNTARLEVSGPAAARARLTGEYATGEHAGAPAVIGARLIRGFVNQLSATMAVEDQGPRITVMITFTISHNRDDPDPAPAPQKADAIA